MSQLTQNLNESTQICDEDDDMNDNDDNGIHGLSSLTPLNPLDVPWARLVPYHGGGGNSGATYDDNNNNDNNINNNNNSGRNTVSSDPIDLLPVTRLDTLDPRLDHDPSSIMNILLQIIVIME